MGEIAECVLDFLTGGGEWVWEDNGGDDVGWRGPNGEWVSIQDWNEATKDGET